MLFDVLLHCLNMFCGILPKPAESLPFKFLLKHSNSFPVTEKMILAQFIFALTFGSLSFCNFDLKRHLKFMKTGSLAFLLHFVGLLFFFCSFILFNSCSDCGAIPQLLYYLLYCFSFLFYI